MKVWAVDDCANQYDSEGVIVLFSTKEKAEKWVEENKKNYATDSLSVIEWEFD